MTDTIMHTDSGERFLAQREYAGYALLDPLKQNIGSVEKVFVNGSGEPEYVRVKVKAGFLRSKTVLIPVSFAEVDVHLCTIKLQ